MSETEVRDPNMDVRLSIKVVDPKTGKVTKEYDQLGNSFVYAFVVSLQMAFIYTTATVQCYDTGHTLRNVYNGNNSPFNCNSPAGTTNYGIVVGTGTAAVTPTDYALGTLCANGTAANNFLYGGHSFGYANAGTSASTTTFSRQITNNSGGAVVIGEVGMYVYNATGGYYYMVMRDLVVPTVSVPNGQNAIISYTLSATT